MMRLRPVSLATWLGAGSVVIVLAAVTLVAISSVRLLREFAEREALAQAQVAATSAREYLNGLHDNVRRTARILAGLPTLTRLLGAGNHAGLRQFLESYCGGSGMDACAVLQEQQIIATTAPDFPWAGVLEASAAQGRRFVLRVGTREVLAFGAMSTSPAPAALRVIVMRFADQRLMTELREQVGADVRVISSTSPELSARSESADLYSAALAGRRAVAHRLKSANVFAAAMPLQAGDGEVVGFIDTALDASGPDAVVRNLALRLRLIALGIIAVAALGGVIYGRRLVRPVTALRKAADRIGRGDFSTAIPTSGVNEIAALGRSMEEMRTNLVELTTMLQRREAEAQAVLSGIIEGVYSVDSERCIRYANPQMAHMLNLPAADMIGRFCGDVLNPSSRDGVRPCEGDCPILAARAGSGHGQAVEQLCAADGRLRSVLIVSAAPVHGQQVQVMRDETALESARRARDSVLANISHEFRTPLAAQLASIELLQDGLERMPGAGQRQLIGNLKRGIVRLMRLIDNLLESVRIESGQLAIRRQPVALQELVAETVALMEPLLAQRRQRLVTDLDADLPMLSADAQRLMQVFVNLLANASKFAPEASEIHVGAKAGSGHVTAWVQDEGPGIADADTAAVFQQFRRSASGEPRQAGLGLGLWIVRSIVERHQGHVAVERTGEGRTRFVVTLPVEAVS
jgi:signal transduction histidine kinase